ncbi:MAG TPA: NAD-dependent epimerase/dehydratase family protein [Dokdonella sp.]|uniref:NAD-dependent epimerase/dehydratase family protein n=1 Tax=Dokdonella sp. TaxID=2291710 RepID=UPI002D810030|nr:NAD-dependent epimerase/dehydratase family protein [Dokdonella sp.]HET9033361.1 NAD-dependent epimerase/dehydratase family protein [Dokdonella sp.]
MSLYSLINISSLVLKHESTSPDTIGVRQKPPGTPAMQPPSGSTLVLGSAGFIGSALCAHLARLGHHVIAFGRSETDGVVGEVTRIRGSIEDRHLLRDALARCSTIVHAASITTPGVSARDPSLEVLGNLLPLSRLLECAAEFPGRRIVYLSSGGAIYGDDAQNATESRTLRPRSYYGAGKAAAEAFLHACVATAGWSAVTLRPSNLYGPGQKVTKGFAIVPTIFDRAVDARPFQIWGDGSTLRDYCYIDDLIEAMTCALFAPLEKPFNCYNIASGQTASILELIEACQIASGRRIITEFHPARDVDVACVSPDPQLIVDELGWKARVDLASGLKRTWDWHQSLGSL